MAWNIQTAFRELIKTFKGGSAMADAVTTSTTGTAFVQLANHPCDSVTMINDSGQTMKVKIKSSTSYISVFSGSYFTFDGINNSEELFIKRKDESNTPLTVEYIYNY
jgi:hypothetical protein